MQQRAKLLADAKPGELVKVDLHKQLEDGEWASTGEEIEVPTLLYVESGKWCVVNDFTPDPATKMQPGRYVTATE